MVPDQLTTQVFPFFEIPNSEVRFVVISLAVGFPIAMLLSWVYEFTPEGVVWTEDLQSAQERSAQRATWTNAQLHHYRDAATTQVCEISTENEPFPRPLLL
jgi:hypothetical protein